jgi:argininosuccinate synthase
MTRRVVVAYGGSLETAAAFATLSSRIGAEIATVTLDLGQGADLEQVREHALAAGAVRAHVVDARRELAADVIRPALVAGAFDTSAHAVAVTRPSIARHLVAVARMEGATAVAHGAVGQDRARLERLLATLAPDLTIHALGDEDLAMGRDGVSQHLWARMVSGASLADQPGSMYARTSAPAALAAHPAVVALTLDRGVPVAVNGVSLELDALIEVIDTIAGDHGVGRFETASEGVNSLVEAPAAVVLGAATRALAAAALPADLVARRAQVASAYGSLIADGGWHTPTRAALDDFTGACADSLTGIVTLELAGGHCRVLDCSTTPVAAYS